MIKEITMYQCVCDNCGTGHSTQDFSCWPDKNYAEDVAVNDDDWFEEDGDHYCPDCVTNIDEDGDVIINITRTKP